MQQQQQNKRKTTGDIWLYHISLPAQMRCSASGKVVQTGLKDWAIELGSLSLSPFPFLQSLTPSINPVVPRPMVIILIARFNIWMFNPFRFYLMWCIFIHSQVEAGVPSSFNNCMQMLPLWGSLGKKNHILGDVRRRPDIKTGTNIWPHFCFKYRNDFI